jgi:dihydroorotate dehydrogenase
MFRLSADEAVINRYGFNSDGEETVVSRLKHRFLQYLSLNELDKFPSSIPKSLHSGRVLGINLGKNKWSPQDSNTDYIEGIRTFASYADYLVINISSPNTPGLRSMQRKEILESLVRSVRPSHCLHNI